jgi:hypothetical protein
MHLFNTACRKPFDEKGMRADGGTVALVEDCLF